MQKSIKNAFYLLDVEIGFDLVQLVDIWLQNFPPSK